MSIVLVLEEEEDSDMFFSSSKALKDCDPEEDDSLTREEEATTPQSCNSCSPWSRSKVEKRCCFLFLESFRFSWKEAYRFGWRTFNIFFTFSESCLLLILVQLFC